MAVLWLGRCWVFVWGFFVIFLCIRLLFGDFEVIIFFLGMCLSG